MASFQRRGLLWVAVLGGVLAPRGVAQATAAPVAAPPAAAPGAAAAAAAARHAEFDLALLDVLRASGIIDQAQYDDLSALGLAKVNVAATEVELIQANLSRLRAADVTVSGGTPGKLTFKSPDGKWSLAVRGRLQTQVNAVRSDNDAEDASNFSVRRARLDLTGNAGAENVTYKFEVDASTNSNLNSTSTSKNAALEEAWIQWARQNGMAFRLGQTRFPFGREELIPAFSQALVERSIASKEFAPQQEPGALLHGKLAEGHWEYSLAVSNGQGQNANNPTGSDQNGLRKGARLVWNPLGPTNYDGSAFQTDSDGGTRFAVGTAYMQNSDSSGLNTVTPGATTGTLGFEFQMFTGPWTIFAETYDRSTDLSGSGDVDADGSTFEIGLFVVPETWELVLRASAVNDEAANDRSEHAVGVNWYLDRQNLKWQLDVSRLDNQGATADAERVRLQLQLCF